MELLREFAAKPARRDARRRVEPRFLRSPGEIRGTGRVAALDIRRNEIVRSDDRPLRARAVDEDVETIECGLVLRSVGYWAVPLPDLPFDERHFVVQRARPLRVGSANGEHRAEPPPREGRRLPDARARGRGVSGSHDVERRTGG